jgi:CO/xanthine dehydrogenase FAD-binding subunit
MLGAPRQPPPFEYHRPATLAEALELIGHDEAAALAGGTDVIPLRNAGAIGPRHLVDVKHLEELRGIASTGDELWVGAAVTCAELTGALDAPAVSALADGAGIVGAVQTRARATVGGNVCRSSPAGDTLCGLLVLGARAELRSRRGFRRVALDEFFTGPGRNTRAADELLVGLSLPRPLGGSAYARFTYRKAMDLAVVGVACRAVVDAGRCVDASVAIGAVAPTPLLVPEAADALVGSAGEAEAVERALDAVTRVASPIDDVRGNARHRLRVLRPLARDVIGTAFERARAAEVKPSQSTLDM